jgi:hypothetical protein
MGILLVYCIYMGNIFTRESLEVMHCFITIGVNIYFSVCGLQRSIMIGYSYDFKMIMENLWGSCSALADKEGLT